MYRTPIIFLIFTFFLNVWSVNAAYTQSLDKSFTQKYEILGIGTAMVDIKMEVSFEEYDKMLYRPYHIQKGSKVFINSLTSKKIEQQIKSKYFIAGGNTANIILDIVNLGGKVGYNTVVGDDKLGSEFRHSITKMGVNDLVSIKKNHNITGHNLIFITPDKEQTVLTFVGQTKQIGQLDIKYQTIKDYKLVFIDAEIWNHNNSGAKAILRSLNFATKLGVKKALYLNDITYVSKYRDDFINLFPQLDIIFVTEDQALELFGTDNMDDVIRNFKQLIPITVITQGEKGALIVTPQQIKRIDPFIKKEELTGINGTNNAFIAGFLYGYTHDMTLDESIEIAHQAALERNRYNSFVPANYLANITAKLRHDS